MNQKRTSNRVEMAILTLMATGTLAACGTGGSLGDNATDGDLEIDQATAYMVASEDESGATGDDAVDESSEDPAERARRIARRFRPCAFVERRDRLVEEYDANGDGTLDESERATLRSDMKDGTRPSPEDPASDASATNGDSDSTTPGEPAARPKRTLRQHARRHLLRDIHWAFDLDGNGKLDRDERLLLIDATRARCEEHRARVLEQFDANDDGTLDEEEVETLRAERAERLEEMKQAILDRFDANDDGQLDREERIAWARQMADEHHERHLRLRACFDADGDGKLNEEEIAALKEFVRAKFAGTTDEPAC